MVAMDEKGKPTAVPKVAIETEDEQRRWEKARLRREVREEVNARYQEIAAKHAAIPTPSNK